MAHNRTACLVLKESNLMLGESSVVLKDPVSVSARFAMNVLEYCRILK
jgi:hypothetical protein